MSLYLTCSGGQWFANIFVSSYNNDNEGATLESCDVNWYDIELPVYNGLPYFSFTASNLPTPNSEVYSNNTVNEPTLTCPPTFSITLAIEELSGPIIENPCSQYDV